MKTYKYFAILLVIIAALLVTSTTAISGGWKCKLTGTWGGSKDCVGDTFAITVQIHAQDVWLDKLSIIAQTDAPNVETFYGNAKWDGGNRWKYTLRAQRPGTGYVWIADGELTYDKSDCEITFDETFSEANDFPAFVNRNCIDEDCTGTLTKVDIEDPDCND